MDPMLQEMIWQALSQSHAQRGAVPQTMLEAMDFNSKMPGVVQNHLNGYLREKRQEEPRDLPSAALFAQRHQLTKNKQYGDENKKLVDEWAVKQAQEEQTRQKLIQMLFGGP